MALADALKDTDGNIVVPAHELAAAMQLWAEGIITRNQALQGARVPTHAETDIDQLASVYQNKATAVEKLAYISRLERCAIVYQNGLIDAGQFNSFVELT